VVAFANLCNHRKRSEKLKIITEKSWSKCLLIENSNMTLIYRTNHIDANEADDDTIDDLWKRLDVFNHSHSGRLMGIIR
jgi:hypothetical protein